MSTEPKLSTLTRSKLNLSVSARDSLSLHRWVLLKNSILNSPTLAVSAPLPDSAPAYPLDDDDDDADEVLVSVNVDTFMFPDAGQLISPASDAKISEAQWLDSLLETLGDDDDEDDFSVDSETQSSTLPMDDEEFHLCSPMSSSDDLINQPTYYSPSSVSVPYSVPYQAYQPPLVHAYHFDSSFSPPYEDPLPYHGQGNLDDLPVPDTIEDTSDDESDAPTTPSLGRSNSSLSLADSSSLSSPSFERSRLRHAHPHPHVYVDPFFDSFEIDPLPFPEHLTTPYNRYQEC